MRLDMYPHLRIDVKTNVCIISDRDGLSPVQGTASANPAAVSSLQVGDAIRVRWVDGSLHSGRFYGKYELVKYQVTISRVIFMSSLATRNYQGSPFPLKNVRPC